jgi:TatD DNase family protein
MDGEMGTLELVDTHCHIHSSGYKLLSEDVILAASDDGVRTLICVGTDGPDSARAVKFAETHPNCYASVGIHPHEAKHQLTQVPQLQELAGHNKVVAIGECGLDYFYEHSPRDVQKRLLRTHLNIAKKHEKPLIFHVRDAFDDFWPIFDEYEGLTGVIHSFTANSHVLEQALSRGLYIGVNGIATFTKKPEQIEAYRRIPLGKLVLETDSPFLTPLPLRGNINEPRHVCLTAEFLCGLRGESLQELTEQTTTNAKSLFTI